VQRWTRWRQSRGIGGGEGEADSAVATVQLPDYGQIRLVVTREAKGTKKGAEYEHEYLVTL